MTLTREQAALVGRIRDALRTLGYKVPTGAGPATFADLVEMTPAIAKFAAARGAAFTKVVKLQRDPVIRARMVALEAEAAARRKGDVTVKAQRVINVVAEGFMAYRAMKKKAGPEAALAGLVKTITAATSR